MNRGVRLLVIILSLLFPFSLAYGGSPIIISHTVKVYEKGDTSGSLDYSLLVLNPGNVPISDLKIELVSLPPLMTEKKIVSIGTLGPRERIELPIHLVTPANVDADRFSRAALLWKGAYYDTRGNPVNFVARSKPGGAK